MKNLKHVTSRVKATNEDGSIRFRLTNMQVDRHGEVVMPKGIRLTEYKKNPIVLFGHGFETNVPIGKINPSSFEINENFVDADIIFDDNDPFAKMIGDKVRNGFLNTGSIGFRPTTVSNDPVLPKQTGVTIKEWELFEFSVVPVPSNSGALALREFRDELKKYKPELVDEPVLTKYFKDAIIEDIDLDDSVFQGAKTTEGYRTITSTTNVDDVDLNVKAGRVLSSKNRSLVEKVTNSLETLMNELKELLKVTEPKAPADDEEDEEEENDIKLQQDLVIRQTLENLELGKIANNLNDLKRIVQ